MDEQHPRPTDGTAQPPEPNDPPKIKLRKAPLALLLGSVGLLFCSLFQLNRQDYTGNAMEMVVVETMTRGVLVAVVTFWTARSFTKDNGIRILSALIAWLGFSGVVLGGIAFKIW